MNTNTTAAPVHSRATIIANLASALRDADASITNIECVIAKRDISSEEISAEFGGTRQLLIAMISQLSSDMSVPLIEGSADVHWRKRLIDFGERVTEIYATSHLRALYRIAITESIRHTGLGRDFYEAGPGRLTQHLADVLQVAHTEGALRGRDSHLLASHFLALLRTHLDEADTFSSEPATTASTRAAYVRNAVDLFCHGIHAGRQSC
jgi:AefR-like transcriptional repressor, C-terminal domain